MQTCYVMSSHIYKKKLSLVTLCPRHCSPSIHVCGCVRLRDNFRTKSLCCLCQVLGSNSYVIVQAHRNQTLSSSVVVNVSNCFGIFFECYSIWIFCVSNIYLKWSALLNCVECYFSCMPNVVRHNYSVFGRACIRKIF